MTNIAGVEIGPGQPCRVVAELSNSHNGSLANAVRLIEECAAAGADLVKFQCYTPDELVYLRGDGPAPEPWGSEGWTMRRLYEKAQTPHEWWPELITACKRAGIPWFSSVFGMGSMALLESHDCPAYKFAALDVDRVDAMVHHVRHNLQAPVIASSRNGRLPWADMTLYCPPGYPQAWGPAEGALLVQAMRYTDGYSYHGTEWQVPRLAARLGASLVEVHVQLDDTPSELEANVSLTVGQLRELCEGVRMVAA